MAVRKQKEKRTDEQIERDVQRCVARAILTMGIPKLAYPDKLGKKIPWKEIEDCARNSNGDVEVIRSFIYHKRTKAFALLVKHHVPKKPDSAIEAYFWLAWELACAHVPAFQIQLKPGRPRALKPQKRAPGHPANLSKEDQVSLINLVDKERVLLARTQSGRITDRAALQSLLSATKALRNKRGRALEQTLQRWQVMLSRSRKRITKPPRNA